MKKYEKIEIKKICEKCKKEFFIYILKDINGKLKNSYIKKFCSRSCANSRIQTKESNDKRRKKLKIICEDRYCIICNNKLNTRNKNIYCKICYKKTKEYHDIMSKSHKGKTGGYNEGSVKNYKSGRYKGFWCDSSWELAFVIYCLDHNIKIQRNKDKFKYIYNDEYHYYYPDFIIDGVYYEIKNWLNNQNKNKIEQFPKDKKIILVLGNENKKYLNYVISKYGKNFINLYE
jgi:hypothetical protein